MEITRSNSREILTDDAFNALLWTDNIEGFVARARDNKSLPTDKKIADLYEMIQKEKFQKLEDNVKVSILMEYQLTVADVEQINNTSCKIFNNMPPYFLREVRFEIQKQNETFLGSVYRRTYNAAYHLKQGDIKGAACQVTLYPVKNNLKALNQGLKTWTFTPETPQQAPSWTTTIKQGVSWLYTPTLQSSNSYQEFEYKKREHEREIKELQENQIPAWQRAINTRDEQKALWSESIQKLQTFIDTYKPQKEAGTLDPKYTWHLEDAEKLIEEYKGHLKQRDY